MLALFRTTIEDPPAVQCPRAKPVLPEHNENENRSTPDAELQAFEDQTLDLHPRFTLLAGDNGAGKTTVLDALAIAAGIWLVKPPDSMLANSGRNILRNEIPLDVRREGDRSRFVECKPVSVTAAGEIAGHGLEWCRQIRLHGSRTTNLRGTARATTQPAPSSPTTVPGARGFRRDHGARRR